MTFLNTKMPMMVFVIIIIEVALLSNQLLELLSRPHEKKRGCSFKCMIGSSFCDTWQV